MKERATQAIVIGGAIAAIVALMYARKKVEKALDTTVAAPIANAVIAVSLPGEVELRGTVQLPNGTRFSLSEINVGSDLAFTYFGKRYRIVKREGNTYFAVV